jgi:beta-glucosidase
MPLIILYALSRLVRYYLRKYDAARRWCWDNGGEHSTRTRIDTGNIAFPAGFLWGTVTSAFQSEGGTQVRNNWTEWEKKKDEFGRSRIRDGNKVGAAANHWQLFREDAELMRGFGLNAYRFSLSWDRIEPRQGEYNAAAIQHYHDEIDALLARGVQPMITLHHYCHPQWFEAKGQFMKSANIEIFVAYCKRVFAEYGGKVKLWITLNEPNVFITGGFFNGTFPPGQVKIQKGAEVLRNLLEAHVRVYYALKQMEHGETARIGMATSICILDPMNPLSPFDVYFARCLDRAFNQSIIDFFNTGRFAFKLPWGSVVYTNKRATRSNDFIGLNYVTRMFVKAKFSLLNPFEFMQKPEELMSDAPNTICPEGFYRALMRLRCMTMPIFVTENGIADAHDDRRHLFLRRYLFALSKAIADGCDVRGYFYNSFIDGFEWAEGYKLKYGLYALDRTTFKRTLRDGSKYYRTVIANHKKQHSLLQSSSSESKTAKLKKEL